MKSKKIKVILLVATGIFLVLQFFRPTLNSGALRTSSDIHHVHEVPAAIDAIFKRACYDCHSNNTEYPWYANIQPFGWWINDHVYEGKEELNFSVFASYSLKKQRHKIHEIEEVVEEGEMPLNSYTIMHGDAELTDTDKKLIYNWVNKCMEFYKGKIKEED